MYISFNLFESDDVLSAKLNILNFHPRQVASRYREPQFQVAENYSYLFNLGPNFSNIFCNIYFVLIFKLLTHVSKQLTHVSLGYERVYLSLYKVTDTHSNPISCMIYNLIMYETLKFSLDPHVGRDGRRSMTNQSHVPNTPMFMHSRHMASKIKL